MPSIGVIKNHWQWATQPNKREKASFLKENILPMEDSGQLNFTSLPKGDTLKDSELGFDIFFADGHTEKQMIPLITYKDKNYCFYGRFITNGWAFTFTLRYGL